MITLAIDTATAQVGVALHGPTGPIGSLHALEGRRHAEVLAPAIQRVCGEAGISLRDVGRVAVDVGPGLFTGLRVGVATADALRSGLRVDAVGLTSVEILAHPHRAGSRPVAALVDVKRGEVAWALYRPTGPPGERRTEEITEPEVLVPALVAARLEAFCRESPSGAGGVLTVGDGALRYRHLLEALESVEVAGTDHAYPSAAVLAEMASVRVGSAGSIAPRYLRQPDVRIGWQRAKAAPGYEPPAVPPCGRPAADGAARG
jgi:tRNA threonylcarbamoyladenosine biosynthesis protein TsaB